MTSSLVTAALHLERDPEGLNELLAKLAAQTRELGRGVLTTWSPIPASGAPLFPLLLDSPGASTRRPGGYTAGTGRG